MSGAGAWFLTAFGCLALLIAAAATIIAGRRRPAPIAVTARAPRVRIIRPRPSMLYDWEAEG